MRKGIIEWGFSSLLLGIYLYYHLTIFDFMRTIEGLEWLVNSPALFAIGGFFVFTIGFLGGKMLTRGMK